MPHGTGRPLFFIHLSVDGQFDYFRLLATVNKDVQAPAGASVSCLLGKHLAAAGLGGVATCVYLSECQTVFRSRHRFMFPAAICESSSSTFLPTFTLFKKKMIAILVVRSDLR